MYSELDALTMACRHVVTARQKTAARLMVLCGVSQYRALREAGYAHYTAKMPGMLLRGSWGLRQAILEALEESQRYLIARPKRKRRDRYDRRSLATNVHDYVSADLQTATSKYIKGLHEETKRLQAMEAGRSFVPLRCSFCRGPLEGKDNYCVRCGRVGA